MSEKQAQIYNEVKDWFGDMTTAEKRQARNIAIYLMGRRIELTPEEKDVVWYVRNNR